MGKISQGAFMGFTGKTGGLVGRRWKGMYTISAYQPNVLNPKSYKQIQNRQFLAIAATFVKTHFANPLRKKIWKGYTMTTGFAQTTGLLFSYQSEYLIGKVNTFVKNQIFVQSTIHRDDLLSSIGVGADTRMTLNGLQLPVTVYFGSEQAITGLELYMLGISSIGILQNGVHPLTVTDVSATKDTTLEATEGYHTTAAACGNWPFVYSVPNQIFATGYTHYTIDNKVSFSAALVANNVVFNSYNIKNKAIFTIA